MTIPFWTIPTLIYVGALIWNGWRMVKEGGYSIMPDITPLLFISLWTIGYLIFWVIYLAVT